MANNKSDRKSRGFRTLATSLDKMTRPIFGKRGLADGAIAVEWPRIVGDSLAKVTLPERISYPKRDRRSGTLYLKVAGGSFATELIHFEPQLIERINRYFGFQAVSQIRITQGPITDQPHGPKARPAHDPATDPAINFNAGSNTGSDTGSGTSPNAGLAHVSDPELLKALKSLGQAVSNRQNERHKTVTKS